MIWKSLMRTPALYGAGALVLLGAMGMSAKARADEPYRFYGGFGAGTSVSDPELTELHLLAGVQAAPHVAVELSDFHIHSPLQGAELSDAHIFNLNAQLQAPEFAHLTAFVTSGIAQTRFHGLAPGSHHATGLGVGAGVQSMVFERVQVRLEWQELNTEGPSTLRPGLVSLTLGMRF